MSWVRTAPSQGTAGHAAGELRWFSTCAPSADINDAKVYLKSCQLSSSLHSQSPPGKCSQAPRCNHFLPYLLPQVRQVSTSQPVSSLLSRPGW